MTATWSLDHRSPLWREKFTRAEIDQLFVRGELPEPGARTVAIVGSRRASTEASEQATRYGAGLARAGVVVVSGGALGVDIAAIRAALSVLPKGVPPLVVLPCGVDMAFPLEHAMIYDNVLGMGGALVSEYPDGVTAMRHRFLRRNRVIMAFSDVALVPHCVSPSGTANAVRHASELGVPLFVPTYPNQATGGQVPPVGDLVAGVDDLIARSWPSV